MSIIRQTKSLISRLLPYEVPRIVIRCGEIPKTGAGKVSRGKVRSVIVKSMEEAQTDG